ncbi:hypothetical protein LCGC14_0376110 [marine sediment metagenome]|uniref:Uncharacterized protein n=1 Tax=marine sediment metagenome TaxID=412755 RepID=A0A0F9WCI8_9ZZZZ
MTIADILKYPVGYKFGGCELEIKHARKLRNPKDKGVWYQEVTLVDETGEMPADVKIGKRNPLRRTAEIHLIVAEIQRCETGKKIYIDQFSFPTQSEPDEWNPLLAPTDVRSRVKCWLVAANVEPGKNTDLVMTNLLAFAEHPMLEKVIDSILKG